MLSVFRHKFVKNCIVLLLMLAIINIAIDPPDLLKNIDNDLALEEDLSINEIESVIELVVEQGLDIQNAIPESDDNDSEDFCKKSDIFSFYTSDYQIIFIRNKVKVCYHAKQEAIYTAIFNQSDSPPPRV